MFLRYIFRLLLLFIELDEKIVIHAKKVAICFCIEAIVTRVFEEWFEFTFGYVVFISFLHIVGIFTFQNLITMRVIPGARLSIIQTLIGLVYLLKLFSSVLIWVFVRMKYQTLFPVSLLNLLHCCGCVNRQN